MGSTPQPVSIGTDVVPLDLDAYSVPEPQGSPARSAGAVLPGDANGTNHFGASVIADPLAHAPAVA
jgi:hypothetical protein